MEMRRDIAKKHVIQMVWAEDADDQARDTLNVVPVVGDLAGRKIGEVGHMTSAKNHDRMAFRDGIPFKDGVARSAAVEGTGGNIGTKRTGVAALA
jgi:hypothetical protein